MESQVTSAKHTFIYKSFQVNKCKKLGHGAYGAVYKAKCDQLPCAAKILHPTILDPLDPGTDRVRERFIQECSLLESIRHPNIVQYLAMALDPESRLPVLLMELLDESLTKMLECIKHSLAYYIQVDICHDIALAIAYLHSNGIIHRDLSSNNVLIIAGRRAKVTDFGMSKLADAAPTMTPLTMCPGTLAYMPPEALREPPRYTKKLDCFSEGVIMIQVCTRLWPEPGPRTQTVQDSRYPVGVIEIPVSEKERRKNHIDLIDPTHPLLPIAVDCLHFQEVERPSSEELCQRLDDLKGSAQYVQSIEQQQNETELQAKEDQIAMLTQQLCDIKAHYSSLVKQRETDHDLRSKIVAQNFADSEQIIERQFSKDVAKCEQVGAEVQQTNHLPQHHHSQPELHHDGIFLASSSVIQQKDIELQVLEKNLMKSKSIEHPSLHTDKNLEAITKENLILKWRVRGKAPFDMRRGAAIVDGDIAYFMHSDGQACSYNSIKRRWEKYSKCPYQQCSLAVINGHLTAIGGRKDNFIALSFSNKLLSFHSDSKEKWEEIFPPMPTKREGTAIISSKEYLIVAGGAIGVYMFSTLNTVEVMDVKNQVWSTVASLPHSYTHVSATICEDHLYMLGGLDDKGNTRSVLTCSLADLLQSQQTSSSVWHSIADTLVNRSTCATVDGQLIALGGLDDRDNPTAAIHKFNPATNSWSIIGSMPTVKFDCLVAIFPQNNEIMLVGGCTTFSALNNIEIARFSC